MRSFTPLELQPSYSLTDSAAYLRLPRGKVQRWAEALDALQMSDGFQALSYVNLLELHVLKSLRLRHAVPFQRIRRALEYVREHMPGPYPLLNRRFSTDGLNLFFEHDGDLLNASRGGQQAMRAVVELYTSRIDWESETGTAFYPFTSSETLDAPRFVQISPAVGFGRPTLTGTGIFTEVIAGRFRAGDWLQDLAEEYSVAPSMVEEAVRWEMPLRHAA